MKDAIRRRYLLVVLRILALVFVFGFYLFTRFWPSGWVWHVGQSNYLQMMIALYATLGIFLFRAAGDPERNLSLISFTIWSSMVHDGTMAVQSILHREHLGHLYGDVPALLIAAAVLSWLAPRAFTLPLTGVSA